MKWFKHFSNASSDPKISKLEDRFGLEGYGFYFKTLEIIALEMGDGDRCEAEYSNKKWGKLSGVSAKRWLKFAEHSAMLQLFSIKKSENYTLVIVPNLLKFRDEYSKKKSRKSGQSPDNVPYHTEEEGNKDKKKNKSDNKKPQTAYQKSKAKKEEQLKIYGHEFDKYWDRIREKSVHNKDMSRALAKFSKCLEEGISGEDIFLAYSKAIDGKEYKYAKCFANWAEPMNVLDVLKDPEKAAQQKEEAINETHAERNWEMMEKIRPQIEERFTIPERNGIVPDFATPKHLGDSQALVFRQDPARFDGILKATTDGDWRKNVKKF